ncbi:MAG TPA: hypothetical protein VK706_05805 [Candidatus Sulfotelmatobacter sp.]|jgi:hypothetical protein|nr:hypothetical protein [Candidatus Sulfotelmatobacter sp.]
MNQRVLFAIALFLLTAFSISVPRAHADEWNQKTKLTFNEPVEIPGQTLPAGTYWFVMLDSSSFRDMVQIFSPDWSVLYGTLVTVPDERRRVSDETVLTFAERPYSKPQAILDWFYPGETVGHHFVYRKNEERELSRDVHQQVVVTEAGE